MQYILWNKYLDLQTDEGNNKEKPDWGDRTFKKKKINATQMKRWRDWN